MLHENKSPHARTRGTAAKRALNNKLRNKFTRDHIDSPPKAKHVTFFLTNVTMLIEWLYLNSKLSHDLSLPDKTRKTEIEIRNVYGEYFRERGWL